MENYIIIPKKKDDQEEEKPRKPLISRIGAKKECANCGEKPKFTIKFGRGVEEVEIKLCDTCMRYYKKKLDNEYGNTFWGVLKAMFSKPIEQRVIKVTYPNSEGAGVVPRET